MTRIITFTDGFTSASSPSINGPSQYNYTILNNQSSNATITTFSATECKSVFINFELERLDVTNEYRQSGNITISWDGSAWIYNLGNYQGDSMIDSALTNDYNVIIDITTTGSNGAFVYKSGNMGASYTGNIKMFVTKVAV